MSEYIRRDDAKAAIHQVVSTVIIACEDHQLPIERRDLYEDLVAALDALPAAGEAVGEAGSPLARLTAICDFACEHCGHSPLAAKPPELTLMEWVLDAKSRLDSSSRHIADQIENGGHSGPYGN